MSGASPAARGDCSFNFTRERAREPPFIVLKSRGFDKQKVAKLFYTGSMQPRGCYPGGAFEFPRTPHL
jgi:hypothetical protein